MGMDTLAGTDRVAEHPAIAGVLGALNELREVDLGLLDEACLRNLARSVETISRRVDAIGVAVAGQVAHSCRGAAADAPGVAAAWLREALTITARSARGRLATAAAITHTVALSGAVLEAELPVLGRALAAGVVSGEHARVVVATMARLHSSVDGEGRELCEKVLVEQARLCDPVELTKVGRHILAMADPDGRLDDEASRDAMEFHIGRRKSNGLTHVWGHLDDETIEMLYQAMSPLAAPRHRRRADAATDGGDGGAGGDENISAEGAEHTGGWSRSDNTAADQPDRGSERPDLADEEEPAAGSIAVDPDAPRDLHATVDPDAPRDTDDPFDAGRTPPTRRIRSMQASTPTRRIRPTTSSPPSWPICPTGPTSRVSQSRSRWRNPLRRTAGQIGTGWRAPLPIRPPGTCRRHGTARPGRRGSSAPPGVFRSVSRAGSAPAHPSGTGRSIRLSIAALRIEWMSTADLPGPAPIRLTTHPSTRRSATAGQHRCVAPMPWPRSWPGYWIPARCPSTVASGRT